MFYLTQSADRKAKIGRIHSIAVVFASNWPQSYLVDAKTLHLLCMYIIAYWNALLKFNCACSVELSVDYICTTIAHVIELMFPAFI